MYINSPGGVITSGMAIYDTMNHVMRQSARSALGRHAAWEPSSLEWGKGMRYALPHARIMIHQPLGGAQGQASDIEIQAKEILRLRDVLNNILAENTGQPLEQIAIDTDRDRFMTALEAKEYGSGRPRDEHRR